MELYLNQYEASRIEINSKNMPKIVKVNFFKVTISNPVSSKGINTSDIKLVIISELKITSNSENFTIISGNEALFRFSNIDLVIIDTIEISNCQLLNNIFEFHNIKQLIIKNIYIEKVQFGQVFDIKNKKFYKNFSLFTIKDSTDITITNINILNSLTN